MIVDWKTSRPYWGPYLLGSNDGETVLRREDAKSASEMKEEIERIRGAKQIHAVFYYEEIKVKFEFDNAIKVVLDNKVKESPMINKDGHFMIWEEDHMNPLFINMLIEKINSMICG